MSLAESSTSAWPTTKMHSQSGMNKFDCVVAACVEGLWWGCHYIITHMYTLYTGYENDYRLHSFWFYFGSEIGRVGLPCGALKAVLLLQLRAFCVSSRPSPPLFNVDFGGKNGEHTQTFFLKAASANKNQH